MSTTEQTKDGGIFDNGSKALLDAITHAGIWEDDSQVELMLTYFGKPCRGGACRVLIQPLEV